MREMLSINHLFLIVTIIITGCTDAFSPITNFNIKNSNGIQYANTKRLLQDRLFISNHNNDNKSQKKKFNITDHY